MQLSEKDKKICDDYIRQNQGEYALTVFKDPEKQAYLREQMGLLDPTEPEFPTLPEDNCSLEEHVDTLRQLRDMALSKGDIKTAITAEAQRGKAKGHYEKKVASISGDTYNIVNMSAEDIEQRMQQIMNKQSRTIEYDGG